MISVDFHSGKVRVKEPNKTPLVIGYVASFSGPNPHYRFCDTAGNSVETDTEQGMLEEISRLYSQTVEKEAPGQ